MFHKKKKLSIIIVNYRSKKHLINCLKSIYDKVSEDICFETIVVNNDEEDSLEDLKRDFPKTIFIDHQKNIGFGSGINLGSQKAIGEILWFLNPDCQIITEKVDAVLSLLKDKVGVVGTSLLNEIGNVQEWTAGKESSLWDIFLNNIGIQRSKKTWQSQKKIKCEWVTGASFFVKKNLFNELDGFDEKFFMYFEDMDLCRRIREIGYDIYFFPQFKVLHVGGASYGEDGKNNKQKAHFYRSQDYYFKKQHGKISYFMLRLIRKSVLRQ